MWCDKCQAEVAAMASPDQARVFCTACGTELRRPASATPPFGDKPAEKPAPPPASQKSLRDPRELLARWAREDALEPLEAPGSQSPRRAPRRYDAPHSPLAPAPALVEHAVEHTPPRIAPPSAAETVTQQLVIESAHPPNPPHIMLPAPVEVQKSSRWMTLVGQVFAYLGVGGLTIGTVLVLVGYFGGPATYATTGWLVATAGQMLLFLGVITLVSGGLEQTTQEVARRIDTLGERLVRIEQASRPARPGPPPRDAARV